MKRILLPLLAVSLFLFFPNCAQREFTQGEYDDMSKERLLDDKFNESDMKQMADAMVQSLTHSPIASEWKTRPVVMVTMVKNRTEEHIDMKMLTDQIKVSLMSSGKFRFSEKETRGEMAEELTYQNDSGSVDPATARKKGKQIGADYFLTGDLTSRVQEVGNKKYIYYKVTFNLVNIQSGILDWAADKELRKYYTKKAVGF